MIITQREPNRYLVKLPFDEGFTFSFEDQEEILELFKKVFERLVEKYKICGDVVIHFYLDLEYGVILDIMQESNYQDEIHTKIIFHLNCKFMVEVNYFDYIGKNQYLYYYKDKFYDEWKKNFFYDGEIIYDDDNIFNEGIKIHV